MSHAIDPAASRPSSNPFRVLREHRNFRLFWTGQTLSLIGTWMQTMAIGWLALQLSNSAFVVGLVASVSAIPVVFLSMHGGALVDHGNRLRIVRITQAVFLAQATTLWLITLTGHISIPWLLGLAFVQGCCSAIEIPARQSLFIRLVGRDDLQPAIALNASGFNLAKIIGPSIGGLVINKLGIGWCFGLNAMSYSAVLWGLARIRLPHEQHVVHSSLREALAQSTGHAVDGIRYLLQPGSVRELLILVTASAILGGPFLTLVPVVARDQLHLGPGGYGSLLTAVGIGGLLGALIIAGPLTRWSRKGRIMRVAAFTFPAALIGLAAAQSLPVAWFWLFVTGISAIIFTALSNGALQLLVEDRYRGRLMAFYGLVFIGLSQMVGSLALGALARAMTAPLAIGVASSILLLVTGAMRGAEFWRRV
ncbi:major facilitator superfamily protein [Gemmatimonas aurantiaca T-27]|uniref:Major facilitator superfamily protein n=1 Tax=Gemmatimonas aurantiaca (strain DSM 14586 / JCM 11422 / NBRC 100505 / T-27) TaxID=379066 RepID=C1A5X0_GEMAT|nr:MFS transporter [Gemmatimonas aurantiaca]BAH37630.1 major facilitator superfamily protein [Gemmatimonas aurantiaca T-27]